MQANVRNGWKADVSSLHEAARFCPLFQRRVNFSVREEGVGFHCPCKVNLRHFSVAGSKEKVISFLMPRDEASGLAYEDVLPW